MTSSSTGLANQGTTEVAHIGLLQPLIAGTKQRREPLVRFGDQRPYRVVAMRPFLDERRILHSRSRIVAIAFGRRSRRFRL